MTLSLYIWYKVGGDTAEARERITAMQIDVADATGIAGRLLVRADDPLTWMEIYEDVGDPVEFERALAVAVAAHEAQQVAETDRHIERFCACGDVAD